MSIYNRQQNLNLNIEGKTLLVIGVGGVGSWAALFAAMAGVSKIIIVDDDIIEESNLNRTPFKLEQIRTKKVHAVYKLIRERREDTIVFPIEGRVGEMGVDLLLSREEIDFIIDARDDNNLTYDFLSNAENVKIVKIGYDGPNCSIEFNSHLHPTSFSTDEGVRYRVTPSYVVPPVVLAALAVNFMISNNFDLPGEYKVVNFNVDSLLQENSDGIS